MKNFILVLMLVSGISISAFSEEAEKKENPAPAAEQEKFNTVFSDVKLSQIGGWGGPVLKVANFAPAFNGAFGLLAGGEGGAIFNRNFYFGIGGYGIVTHLDKYQVTGLLPSGNLVNLSYGGLVFKYHFFPKSVVNFSIGALVGAGGFGNSLPHTPGTPNPGTMYPVFAAEPEIYLFLNLAKFCRVGVGGSYRFFIDDGAPKAGLAANNLWGYSINVMFQFGRF